MKSLDKSKYKEIAPITLSKVPVYKNTPGLRRDLGLGKNSKNSFPNPVATSNKNRPKTDLGSSS